MSQSLWHGSDENNNQQYQKDRGKKDQYIPKITHLIFMGTSYDIKEKVYVALVDNSEALEQSDLTYEDTKETRPYISLKRDRFITDSH